MNYDVFVSYARRDGTPLARKIAEKLRDAGLTVFWDQDSIPAGANWEQKLDEALEQAEHILVVLTPFSVISEEVSAEWRPMLSRGKNVIPLMAITSEVPRRLSMRQYIDFRDEDRFVTGLTELINAINSFRPGSADLEMNGAELMQRAQSYFESGEYDLAASDYLQALKDDDLLIRGRAARFLGKLRMMSVFPVIMQYTHEEGNLSVLLELLTTIRRYAELTDWRSVVPDLPTQIERYLRADDADIRKEAIRVLAYGQATEAAALVIERLAQDRDAEVRKQAALSLGRLKTTEGLQGLLAALNDADETVRVAVVNAIGVHNDLSTISSLRAISRRDRSAQVRAAASEVIDQIERRK